MNLRHYLENQKLLSENRLPSRSLLLPAKKRGVTHVNQTDSAMIISLNGDWNFHYLDDGKISEEYASFDLPEYDDSKGYPSRSFHVAISWLWNLSISECGISVPVRSSLYPHHKSHRSVSPTFLFGKSPRSGNLAF